MANVVNFHVLFNMRFLAERRATQDLQNQDRDLFGGENTEAIQVLVDIYVGWVAQDRVLAINLRPWELSKLATANAFLIHPVSCINVISELFKKLELTSSTWNQ